MTNLWTEQLANCGGHRVAAATEIARRLSTQDPSDPFKAPYSPENALIAVCDLAEHNDEPLSNDERNAVVLALTDGRSASEIAAGWEEGNVPEPDPEDEIEA